MAKVVDNYAFTILKSTLAWEKYTILEVEVVTNFSYAFIGSPINYPYFKLNILKRINILAPMCPFNSQEHLGAPIYWSPKILFSTFWKGMKRKSYDKTRFCVSHEGLSNGLGTFGLTWYMFENKTKNMFLIWRGSNVLEPRLQYNGARAPIYWSHQFFFPIRQ